MAWILRYGPARRQSRPLGKPGGACVPRPIWKGVITFGMVSIPVRLFGATEDKDIRFHLLHRPDHGRIKFKRWCSIDDHEVPSEELVRAFEITKEHYVELTDEDLAK